MKKLPPRFFIFVLSGLIFLSLLILAVSSKSIRQAKLVLAEQKIELASPSPLPSFTPSPSPSLSPSPAPIAVPLSPIHKPSPNQLSPQELLLVEINKYRASRNLKPLATSLEVCNFAQTRAQEISTGFNHEGFNNRVNSKTLPYKSFSEVVENIAQNSNYKEVLNSWLNSPPHTANLEKDVPFGCVAILNSFYVYEGLKP
jgi:uncharacterized protein YkwD